MRILHVVTAFPRSTDDVIVPWLVELLKHLRAAGHDVEVLTSAYKGGGNREFAGIPVHRFRYFPARWEDLTHEEAAPDRMRRSWRYRIMPPFYVVCGMWAAWRQGRRRRYDVVHVHWPVPHALFGWAVQRACGARMVTSWYGAELRWVKGSLPWLRPFVRWALAASDQVVAISSYTAREIAEALRRPAARHPLHDRFHRDGHRRGPGSGARRLRGAVRGTARGAKGGTVPHRCRAAAFARPARPARHHRRRP